tara:strand:- start:111 stop:257 length:147 start_codon:yes stop_codon:yes gene_type:complete
MPTNIDSKEMLGQKQIQEYKNVDYSLITQVEPPDSELSWIKLHQMFDK